MRWGSAGSGNGLYEERKVGERRQENQSVGLCPQSLVLGPASRGTCRRYDHGPSVRPLHGSWGAQQRGPARNGSWELWAPFSGRGVGLGGASGWGHGAARNPPTVGLWVLAGSGTRGGAGMGCPDRARSSFHTSPCALLLGCPLRARVLGATPASHQTQQGVMGTSACRGHRRRRCGWGLTSGQGCLVGPSP